VIAPPGIVADVGLEIELVRLDQEVRRSDGASERDRLVPLRRGERRRDRRDRRRPIAEPIVRDLEKKGAVDPAGEGDDAGADRFEELLQAGVPLLHASVLLRTTRVHAASIPVATTILARSKRRKGSRPARIAAAASPRRSSTSQERPQR